MTERPPLSAVPAGNIVDLDAFRRKKALEKRTPTDSDDLTFIRQTLARWAHPAQKPYIHEVIHQDFVLDYAGSESTRLAQIVKDTDTSGEFHAANQLAPIFHQAYLRVEDLYRIESLNYLRATNDTQLAISAKRGMALASVAQVLLIIRAIEETPGHQPGA